MNRLGRAVRAGFIAGACALVAGCAGTKDAGSIDVRADASLPSYESLAARYNERAALLGRVWARAVVEMRFVDSDGRNKREQGEGHFQFIAPDRFALSVGKLGEVIVYLGCDDERFWMFERGDADRLSVCRHENAGTACSESIGLPARPLEIIDLVGVLQIPARGGTVRRSTRGEIVIDIPTSGGFTRLAMDESRLEPSMIGIYNSGGSQPVLLARLDEYANVQIAGRGGIPPRVASRIFITHDESDTEIRLWLAAMTDGVRERRLPPEAFNLDSLINAFNPREIRVLDAACPNPAIPSGR